MRSGLGGFLVPKNVQKLSTREAVTMLRSFLYVDMLLYMAYKDISKEKEYQREYQRKWRIRNPKYQGIYHKTYRRDNKEKLNSYSKKVWKSNDEVRKRSMARNRVHYAIKNGNLFRCPCVVCGKRKVQAHHDDYSKPLDVLWLCVIHHRLLHKKKRVLLFNK